MSNSYALTIYCDGGSRGNPGEAAYGFVIYQNDKVIFEQGKRIGINTNNVAEYSAVIESLRYLTNLEKKDYNAVNYFLDSMLVVKQMNGEWKVKNENIRNLVFTAKSLERSLGIKTSYTAIPREKNTAADAMVNLALDNKI